MVTNSIKIPLRVVFYSEEDAWVAHCLEFDLVGTGASQDDAVAELFEAIATQFEYSLRSNNMENLFTPADGKYFLMWAQGTNIASGQIHVPSVKLEGIEGFEAREFVDGVTMS